MEKEILRRMSNFMDVNNKLIVALGPAINVTVSEAVATIIEEIKKGVLVPTVSFEVMANDEGLDVGAIDQEAYAEWLALEPSILCVFKDVSNALSVEVTAYDGSAEEIVKADNTLVSYGIVFGYAGV